MYSGFPTDMQSQITAVLTIADGISTVHETIFESRNKHISELLRMGADIILSREGTTFIINGVNKLQGVTVEAKDLRGGAALIIAGLAAEGTTIVKKSVHIQRGYDDIEISLKELGADIEFIK